eukprot:723487_1
MPSNNNSNNARFLRKQKPKLKKRLSDHLELRENEINQILQKTFIHIDELGYQVGIKLPQYNKSFINTAAIDTLIDNWNGLQIRKRPITESEYHSKSVNWLDQNSKKVSGPFFAKHFTAIKKHLINYSQYINVSTTKQKHILNYSCIYFTFEILCSKVSGFTRCRPQPLIRHTTLAKSKDVYNGFQRLCSINLAQLVAIVKNNTKISNPTKKQNRIDCKEFAQHLSKYCNKLLQEHKRKLTNEKHSINPIIPTYFKNSQVSQQTEQSTMELDENSTSDNSCSQTTNSISEDTLTPPNTIDFICDIPPSIFNQDTMVNSANIIGNDCKCDYEIDSTFMPPPVYYNPSNYWYSQYYNYPHMYQSTQYQNGYYGSHGGYGSTADFRYSPMDSIQHVQTISYQNVSHPSINNEYNIMPSIANDIPFFV